MMRPVQGAWLGLALVVVAGQLAACRRPIPPPAPPQLPPTEPMATAGALN